MPVPRINNKYRQDSLVNFGGSYGCWAFLRTTAYCRDGDWRQAGGRRARDN